MQQKRKEITSSHSILASSYPISGTNSSTATPSITSSWINSLQTVVTDVIHTINEASYISTSSSASSISTSNGASYISTSSGVSHIPTSSAQGGRPQETTSIFLSPLDTMSQTARSISASVSFKYSQAPMSSSYFNQTTPSKTSSQETVPEYVKIMLDVQIGILVTTLALSVVGNSLVVAVMYRRMEKVSVANFLIAHLAVCDLIFALFTPMIIHSIVYNYQWMFGLPLCKIVRSAIQLGSNVAAGIIVVIAVDRYRGISDPLRPRWKKRHAAAACGIVWILSVLSITPSILVLDLHPTRQLCYENWNYFSYPHSAKIYSLFYILFGFFTPVITIAILYGKIIKFLKSPQVKFAQSSLTKEYLDRRRKEDQRVTKLLSLVVVAFVICILPNKFIWVILDFAGDKISPQVQRILGYIAILPYPFHVAVNPIIYSVVDLKFRRNAKDLLLCRTTQRRSSFASSQCVTRNSVSMHTLNENID